MKEKISGVYTIEAPDGRLYIGSSVDVEQRWSEHKSKLRNGKHDNPILSEIVAEHGLDSLRHRLMFRCVPDSLRDQEQAAIDRLKPALNVLPTAERLLTEQWKRPGFRARNSQRASEQNAARWRDPDYAKKASARVSVMQTNEAKAKSAASRRRSMKERGPAYQSVAAASSATLKRLHADPEFAKAHAERKRKEMLERCQDPEFCRRRDEAAAAANRKPIRCLNTGEVFPSKEDAAKGKGISVSVISKQLRGLPTRTGLRWEYLNG
ncbi:GIY-YIG nuclease family protein [Achromobacter xylosoxidans]|jgi:group I intron endonuclease|uniref:GIY-YIG nuclease family protein n=1 Tax=Alcaligenes xylosoxydans xylosoxydans TaxID=85698 RepID=UPI001F14563C|nr:GIY-YIG nuclease family protein [Achromobacter xylosoxidans]